MSFDRIDARPVPYSLGSSQVLDKDLLQKQTEKLDGNEQASSSDETKLTSLGEDRFVTEELADVEKTLASLNYFTPQVAIQEPTQLYRGLIRYAKTPWNPIGDGYEGLVSYDGSTWSRIGLDYDTDITDLQAQITANDGDITSLTSGKANVSHTHAYTELTGITTDSLVGRDTTGTGVAELITLGTNLSLTSGVLNAAGGSKIIRNWLPTDASFPASNFPTLDTRNTHPVLDFPTGGSIAAYFHGVVPDNYAGGNIDVALYVAMTSATSGNINFAVRIENLAAQDLDSTGWGGYGSAVTAVSGTSGIVVESVISMTGANLDGLAAGDPFRIEVTRHTASRPSDTATGDAELLMVEMRIQ